MSGDGKETFCGDAPPPPILPYMGYIGMYAAPKGRVFQPFSS